MLSGRDVTLCLGSWTTSPMLLSKRQSGLESWPQSLSGSWTLFLYNMVFISIDCNACRIVVLCTCDIYCTPTRLMERDPSTVIFLEFSCFSLSRVFGVLPPLAWEFKGRGCCYVQNVKPSNTNCYLWLWTIQIKLDLLLELCNTILIFFTQSIAL